MNSKPMKPWQEADFSTAKKWDPFTYMKIQCQTWLAPEAALKKIRRKGKKGRRRRRVGAGEMSLCTAGVTRTDNAVQAGPAARFSSYRLQCRPEWLQSKVSSSTKNQNQRAAPGNPIGKDRRRGSAEMQWGRSGSSCHRGYCNPSPAVAVRQ